MILLVKSAHVVDPKNKIDEVLDLVVEDGKVAQIGKNISVKADEVYDANELHLFPALVDLHTHFREPGFEHKETIETGAAAARHGGYVACVSMPNTNPPADNQGIIEEILRKADEAGITIVPCGTVTKGRQGKELAEMAELKAAGARCVSEDGSAVADSLIARRAMEYAATVGLLFVEHAEDPRLGKDGVMNESFAAAVLGLKGKPAASEDVITARDIELAQLTGVRLHFAHVSTRRSIELIRRARKEGLSVTCDVTPHHLALTDEDIPGYDSNFKVNPPLRASADREALRAALRDGTVDAIATDHAPHQELEKDVEFDIAPFGTIGLETALAVVLTELVHTQFMPLPEVIRKMSTAPAELLGLDGLGQIRVGSVANFTLVDINREWVVRKEDFLSKSKNSCFLGRTLKGKVMATMCKGKMYRF